MSSFSVLCVHLTPLKRDGKKVCRVKKILQLATVFSSAKSLQNGNFFGRLTLFSLIFFFIATWLWQQMWISSISNLHVAQQLAFVHSYRHAKCWNSSKKQQVQIKYWWHYSYFCVVFSLFFYLLCSFSTKKVSCFFFASKKYRMCFFFVLHF